MPSVTHIVKHAYKDENMISEDAESPEKLSEDNLTNMRSRKNKGTFDLVSEDEKTANKELKQIKEENEKWGSLNIYQRIWIAFNNIIIGF